ncbi:MAG: multidrug ABC transporter permease [Alphaproteobacteria bacterium]|nr:MAG: multidrug ABC transporter permease [Alphaproteobacteria bacterium]
MNSATTHGQAANRPALPPHGMRRIGRINRLGLWTLYQKEVWRFLKVWLQTLAAPAIQAVLFFLIFAIVLGGSGRASAGIAYPQFLAPGLIVMALLQNAFANTSSSLIISKVQGTIIDVLMPPLSAGEIAIGYVAGGMTRGLMLAALLCASFALLPLDAIVIHDVFAIIYFALAGSAMLSLIGLLTGIWAEKFDHVATITNFVVAPLTLLSGTFYSLDRLRDSLGGAARWLDLALAFNPFFYVIDGFRYGFIGRADSNIMTGVIGIGLFDLALGLLAWHLLRRGWRLKP